MMSLVPFCRPEGAPIAAAADHGQDEAAHQAKPANDPVDGWQKLVR
jgi:hypothetical protein